MKIFKMVPLMLLAVLAFSMISGATAAQSTSVYNTKMMNVHVNENVPVNLTSNPSTGYTWVPIFNSKYVKLVSHSFTPNANPKLIGAAGVEHFVFKTLKKGDTNIFFKYIRHWDKNHPAKTIILHLKITK